MIMHCMGELVHGWDGNQGGGFSLVQHGVQRLWPALGKPWNLPLQENLQAH